MAHIISTCNQKGGVGKTTTAVNLAACLAALEKKVLLVDMDPQGNASQGVGVDEVMENDIYDALSLTDDLDKVNAETIKKFIYDTDIEFLKCLPASTQLAAFEIELMSSLTLSRERRLEQVLQTIKDDFDYIIIDCPPSLNLLTINVLTATKSVIIPIQCEYYALQGLAELYNTIRLVRQNLNPELEVEGALLTMYDSRLTLSKQVAEEVQNDFQEKVFKTLIRRNVKLSEAPSYGKPIILYDILCPGARGYMELAEEIILAKA